MPAGSKYPSQTLQGLVRYMISFRLQAALERARCAIGRRLGFDVNLLSFADSVEELHPAEQISGDPCISLPGQYDRVTACAFRVDLGKEVAALQGAPRKAAPTLRYVFDDVIVCDNIIYRRGRRKLFNLNIDGSHPSPPWAEHGQVTLRSSFIGCHFFGDWLLNDCATHLVADHGHPVLSMPTPAWPDQGGYIELFGQDYGLLDRAHVRRIILFDDISHNSHKVKRLRKLRARVTRSGVTNTNRIVYVVRGASGERRALINEREILEALEKRGIVVVRAEALSVRELISELLGARIIIGVEGSQLAHAVYTLREEGGVLAIQPPARFFNAHLDWARALGMQYGIVVGEERQAGFFLPVDDLFRTIDLMDTSLS
jgi:glycosyl transferase family 61